MIEKDAQLALDREAFLADYRTFLASRGLAGVPEDTKRLMWWAYQRGLAAARLQHLTEQVQEQTNGK